MKFYSYDYVLSPDRSAKLGDHWDLWFAHSTDWFFAVKAYRDNTIANS